MKLQFWAIGKQHDEDLRAGIHDFTRRLSRYISVDWHIIPVPKNAGMLSEADLRAAEAMTVMDWLDGDDYLVALDEHGKEMRSEDLAAFMSARMNSSVKRVIFLIGGAYGLDRSVLTRADYTWSLSQLTFPHQLVRLILAEQLYRAYTIIRNEKYHHR